MFEDQATAELQKLGVSVGKIENESELSLVYHLSNADREIVEKNRTELEGILEAAVATSDMFGMSVAIIESLDVQ